jgi:hypothetical protein
VLRGTIEAQTGAIRRVQQHLPPTEIAAPAGSNVFPPTKQAGLCLVRHQSRRFHQGSNDATARGLMDVPLVPGASPAGDHRTPCGAFPVPPTVNVA